MRVLQVTSDWKWTGPAAPLVELLCGLRDRGVRVDVACPEPPAGGAPGFAGHARAEGFEPVLELARARGARPLRDARDTRRLAVLLREGDYDVVHAWHTRDHLLALRARPRGVVRPRIVRTWRGAEPVRATPWNRWLFGPGSDGLLCTSEENARQHTALRRGRAVAGAPGAVDLERFRPAPPDLRLRRSLGIGAADRVVGVVLRVQARRRFDLLLEAFELLSREDPRARMLVVGRGTQIESLAKRPARARGLGDRVCFAGWRGVDYADVIRCSDVASLVVPGSDGGCRAILEAAACGIPAVTSRRGALPEIVVEGETGLFADETPGALAAAWASLLGDPERRASMGRAARARAEAVFSRERYAQVALDLYAARPTAAARRRPPRQSERSSTSSSA